VLVRASSANTHSVGKIIEMHNYKLVRTGRMQLVFVEDDVVIRDAVVEYLREHGFEVIEAATAEDAMHRLHDAPMPSLVVTDIDLGTGCSGVDLADWLHARWPDLNVVFATGRLDQLEGRALDPRETCLGKPFRLSALTKIVRRLASSASSSETEVSSRHM
jgi:DNA-binding NtrC family response regulator